MSLDSWRQAGQHLEYRGHSVFYREGGAGEALLCIHGFPSASWDWEPMWPRLTSRFRVIAADMLGFGFSDKPTGHDYSILEGVRNAFDEFTETTREKLIELPTTQCMMIKTS